MSWTEDEEKRVLSLIPLLRAEHLVAVRSSSIETGFLNYQG